MRRSNVFIISSEMRPSKFISRSGRKPRKLLICRRGLRAEKRSQSTSRQQFWRDIMTQGIKDEEDILTRSALSAIEIVGRQVRYAGTESELCSLHSCLQNSLYFKSRLPSCAKDIDKTAAKSYWKQEDFVRDSQPPLDAWDYTIRSYTFVGAKLRHHLRTGLFLKRRIANFEGAQLSISTKKVSQ